jgi:hypothetical protein
VVSKLQEVYIGVSTLSLVRAPANIPPSSLSPGEMVRVEVLKANLKEGPVPVVPTREKKVKALLPVEVVDANAIPHINDDRVNEGEPGPEGTPGRAASIPRSPRGPSFCLPRGDCLG